MPENSSLLPALKSSRVGVGVTTLALVALASGSTGVLVANGTKQLQPRTTVAAPPAQVPLRTPPVVVDRAPGSIAPRPAQLPGPAAAPRQPAGTGPVVPPVPVTPAEPPVVEPPVVEPPAAPPVEPPPAVEPPAESPPVVLPPEVEPPVLRPTLGAHGKREHSRGRPEASARSGGDRHAGKVHGDNGKHVGQDKHGR